MKKLSMILIAITMSTFVMAQEKTKHKEVGLVFSNLSNFGVTYKTGTEKSLWRFTALSISGGIIEDVSDDLVYKRSSTGFGIKIGKELRKNIAENLEFRYGADLSFSYHNSISKKEYTSNEIDDNISKSTTYVPGINLVLGFNYMLNNNVVIGAELLPFLDYRTGSSTSENNSDSYEVVTESSGFIYGLSSSSALLSLMYRF